MPAIASAMSASSVKKTGPFHDFGIAALGAADFDIAGLGASAKGGTALSGTEIFRFLHGLIESQSNCFVFVLLLERAAALVVQADLFSSCAKRKTLQVEQSVTRRRRGVP
jgi:hypothetical protein